MTDPGRLEEWRRGHRWWDRWWDRWWILALLWGLVIPLGILGLDEYHATKASKQTPRGPNPEFADIAYETLRLFTFDVSLEVEETKNVPLQIARFMAPFLLALTTIKALIALFYDRYLRLRAKLFRDHVIVVGAGRKGRLLAERFCDDGKDVIVVDQDESAKTSGLELAQRGMPLVIGDATHPSTLRSARIQRASILACLTGDDRTNAEIAFTARNLAPPKKKWIVDRAIRTWKWIRDKPFEERTLDILVHVLDRRLCKLLNELELERASPKSSRLHFFSLYDRAARILVEESDPFERTRSGVPNLLVIGFGPLCQSFLVQMAQKWPVHEHSRFKVTVVDRNAAERLKPFFVQYPSFERRCDLQGVSAAPGSPSFEEASFLSERSTFTKAYVLLDSDSAAVAATLLLLDRLANHPLPIVLSIDQENSFLASERAVLKEKSGVEVIGLLDRVLKPGLLFTSDKEILAKAIHEEYLADQQRRRVTPGPIHQPWKLLTEEYKEINRRQADDIGKKLEAVNCELVPRKDWDKDLFQFNHDEVEKLAKMEHERWMEDKERQDWTRGERDEVRKTHPDMVPWEELSEEARNKDRNAVRHLPALVAKVGFDIRRKPQ